MNCLSPSETSLLRTSYLVDCQSSQSPSSPPFRFCVYTTCLHESLDVHTRHVRPTSRAGYWRTFLGNEFPCFFFLPRGPPSFSLSPQHLGPPCAGAFGRRTGVDDRRQKEKNAYFLLKSPWSALGRQHLRRVMLQMGREGLTGTRNVNARPGLADKRSS